MASNDNSRLQRKRRRLGWIVNRGNKVKLILQNNQGRKLEERNGFLSYHKSGGPEEGFYMGEKQIPLRSIVSDNSLFIASNVDYLNNGGKR